MKKDIHPNYREVLFLDITNGKDALIRSTIPSTETTTWKDGNTYPLVKVEISSYSYSLDKKQVFTGGRVERFMKKYSKNK